ncbi:MAG: molybdopterin-binding protein [Candidatus Bathyarchaeota archaeon]
MVKKTNRKEIKLSKKVNFAVIICNSIFYEKSRKNPQLRDDSSDLIVDLVTSAGHNVNLTLFLPEDRVMLTKQVGNAISSKTVDAIIVCGGTGLRISEITLECLRPLMVKTMPGFAELSRKLSYDKLGSKAMILRALAGITDQQKALFCIPKSLNSIELIIKKLILPEIEHILEKTREY